MFVIKYLLVHYNEILLSQKLHKFLVMMMQTLLSVSIHHIVKISDLIELY